jgi:hypothetical protein
VTTVLVPHDGVERADSDRDHEGEDDDLEREHDSSNPPLPER